MPYASLYDISYIAMDGSKQHIRRNGCLGCATDFSYQNNHLYILRQTHRQAWNVIMKSGMAHQIRNLQRAMRQGQYMLFDSIETNELIEIQPCAFDDLDGFGGMIPSSELVYDPEV